MPESTPANQTATSDPKIYRYRVKGDPREWSYSTTPFFGPNSAPGSNEDHEEMTLKQAVTEFVSTKSKSSETLGTLRESINALVAGARCKYDMLNPCFDSREHDTPGKHWGGEDACDVCTARAFISLKMLKPDTYVVVNENTLGYVHADCLHMVDVLAGAVLKGGPDPLNGPVPFNPSFDKARRATVSDFEAFRVSPAGHLY